MNKKEFKTTRISQRAKPSVKDMLYTMFKLTGYSQADILEEAIIKLYKSYARRK